MNPPIVIATDFSAAANNALAYAARLAGRLQSTLHVVSVNVTLPPLTAALPEDTIAQMAYVDLLAGQHERTRAETEQARAALERDYPGLPVQFNILEGGGMADALLEYARKESPLLLVLGTHHRDGAAGWDSNGLDLLKHAAYPLLMIPESYPVRNDGSRALLAWDGRDIDARQRVQLARLRQVLGLRLDAVYVRPESGPEPGALAIGELPVTVHTVIGNNVAEGLNNYLSQDAHDLLVVLPHHHNLWERLFFKLHTADIVSEISVPVLVIPEVK
ncbi:MAG: universal stress protein [Chitinophagaceae bacterium]|nr:MAG: universal stress protein [Chitinophagaceae bacterium]